MTHLIKFFFIHGYNVVVEFKEYFCIMLKLNARGDIFFDT